VPEFPETSESLIVRVRDPSNRAAWDEFEQLYRITCNAILKALTRGPLDRAARGSQILDVFAEMPSVDPDTSALIDLEYRRELFQRAAEQVRSEVHETTWLAFEQTVLNEKSIARTAKMLGVSTGSIVASADATIASAEKRLEANQAKLVEHREVLKQAIANNKREQDLEDKSRASELRRQQAQQKVKAAIDKFEQLQALVLSTENELASKHNDRKAKEQQAETDVANARLLLNKASSELNKTQAAVAKAQADLAKAQKEVLEMQTKLARQTTFSILAPSFGPASDLTRRLRELRERVASFRSGVEVREAKLRQVTAERKALEKQIEKATAIAEKNDVSDNPQNPDTAAAVDSIQEDPTVMINTQPHVERGLASIRSALESANKQLAEPEAELETIIKVLSTQIQAAAIKHRTQTRLLAMTQSRFEQGDADAFEALRAKQPVEEHGSRIGATRNSARLPRESQ